MRKREMQVMEKDARLSKLHARENLAKWHWEAKGYTHLVAVPYPRENWAQRFIRGQRAPMFIAVLSALLALLFDSMGFEIPVIIFAFIGVLSLATALLRSKHSRVLYSQALPLGDDFRRQDKIPHLTQNAQDLAEVMNIFKWRMENRSSDKNIKLAKESYDTCISHIHKRSNQLAGKSISFFMEKNREYFQETVTNHRQEQLTEDTNKRSDGGLGEVKQKEDNSGSSDDSNSTESNLSDEAKAVITFFGNLAEEHPRVKQLPLAAQRWGELSPMDQSNLTLLMNELTPSLATVDGAKAEGQGEFLERATASLEKSISLAEQVAKGMNSSVERAKLNAMDISGNFIEAAFADKLAYSLEDEPGVQGNSSPATEQDKAVIVK